MKTKTEIIQILLDEKKITAEDAVVLLTPDEHVCTCKKKNKKTPIPFPPIPFPPITPINPNPYIPNPYNNPYPNPNPYVVTCKADN